MLLFLTGLVLIADQEVVARLTLSRADFTIEPAIKLTIGAVIKQVYDQHFAFELNMKFVQGPVRTVKNPFQVNVR